MDERTLNQYRIKAAQWDFAARMVEQMRLEQGPGELNFDRPPEQVPPLVPTANKSQPILKVTKDRT